MFSFFNYQVITLPVLQSSNFYLIFSIAVPSPADISTSELQGTDEIPVIIILVVCIVGVFILTLNVGLILFFIRRRKKRLEGMNVSSFHHLLLSFLTPYRLIIILCCVGRRVIESMVLEERLQSKQNKGGHSHDLFKLRPLRLQGNKYILSMLELILFPF